MEHHAGAPEAAWQAAIRERRDACKLVLSEILIFGWRLARRDGRVYSPTCRWVVGGSRPVVVTRTRIVGSDSGLRLSALWHDEALLGGSMDGCS